MSAKQSNSGGAQLTKLKIMNADKPSEYFEVPINPAAVRMNYGINYDETLPQGKVLPDRRWKSNKAVRIDFEFIFDGTGAAKRTSTPSKPVQEQIEQFKSLCLNYVGEKHEPNEVVLAWGTTLNINCRLSSLDLSYELFKPNGDPLRAKAKVSFEQATNPKDEETQKNSSSPDLSHVYPVRQGDTLPLMCYRVYGKSELYLEVAKANNMTNFRQLKMGTKILFPPIKTRF